VGTIICDGGIRGVATHIQLPDGFDTDHSVIVSAAHVLYDPQTNQLFNQCHYRPQNKRLSGIGFKAISALKYSVQEMDKIAQAEGDIVFIELKSTAYQPALKLRQDTSNAFTNLVLIGPYADSFKQTKCHKINHHYLKNNKLLLHSCAVKEGDSGSPIIDSERGEIIAVHGGRLAIQTTKESTTEKQWMGQARRIDITALKLLSRLTSENFTGAYISE
jgi:V8-like Glu-specific endopeptidase